MGYSLSLQTVVLSLSCLLALCSDTKPNIIFMMVDDIGFNDMGYLGCTLTRTPNIDALMKRESLTLWHNYAFKLCSPTRAAFLSGRNPSTLGLQNLMFAIEYPVALTRQVSVLSEEFKANGYSTHMIGKWHLGFPSQEYTPTYRGFDTFTGFLSGMNGYFDHTFDQILDSGGVSMYDYWLNDHADNATVKRGLSGEFSIWTEKNTTIQLLETLKDKENPFFLYLAWQSAHTPDEAPDKYLDIYSSASSSTRQSKQAQMHVLDMSVRDVVHYLKENDMWDDTLIVFTSDNGGDYDRGDNSPLRQYKNTSFEGGIRVPGFVTGGFLAEDRRGQVMDEMVVHMTDWYRTLLSAAGLEVGYYRSKRIGGSDEDDTRFDHIPYGTVELDGVDIWQSIQYGNYEGAMKYEDREILLDLDSHINNCTFNSCGALRKGKWKFLRGANQARASPTIGGKQWQREFSTCHSSDVLRCSSANLTFNSAVCMYTENGCLFDMDSDPCEVTNLGDEYPEIRDYFIGRLDYHESRAPNALMLDIDQLDYDDYAPEIYCDTEIMGYGQFWCPFMMYNAVGFEEKLLENYATLWAGLSVNDTTENQKKALEALKDLTSGDSLLAASKWSKWKRVLHGHGMSSWPLLRASNVIVICFMLTMMSCVMAIMYCGGWKWNKTLEDNTEYRPLLIH